MVSVRLLSAESVTNNQWVISFARFLVGMLQQSKPITAYSSYPPEKTSHLLMLGNTFYSVILIPWVLVRPESYSRPPAWQADAQPTEPSIRGSSSSYLVITDQLFLVLLLQHKFELRAQRTDPKNTIYVFVYLRLESIYWPCLFYVVHLCLFR